MRSQNTAHRIAQNPETEWLDTCGVVDPIEEVYIFETECPEEETDQNIPSSSKGLCGILIFWLSWCG